MGETMSNSGLLVGWSRAQSGKEKVALGKFGEFTQYVAKLQAEKQIDSFEPVLLRPHGGDLNGFFLLRADVARLAVLRQSDQWKDWEVTGAMLLDGFGVIECSLADNVADTIGRIAKQV
jgi:hypothetical protein